MAWRERYVMDERMRFVVKALEGESISKLCEEFGISRKTGYKFLNRYKAFGIDALRDENRKPLRNANRLSVSIEDMIVALKENKPDWGARKIRELFTRKYPELQVPAASTVHAVLSRNGKVKARKGRVRYHASGTPLGNPTSPNDAWGADFKGEFRMGDNRYCYPLTISDLASRYLFACEAFESTAEKHVFPIFEEVFKERGLPRVIRTDNGVPFASNGLFGLSKLSVWWLTLGIGFERIVPGNPQQNGRHERMHRTLKAGTTKPPGINSLQQQEKFDAFIHEFNNERPHEALDMKCPAECYSNSPRPFKLPEPFDYRLHDRSVKVTSAGYVCFAGTRVYVSAALEGQYVGISEVDDDVHKISFLSYDLGFCDLDSKKFEQGDSPFDITL